MTTLLVAKQVLMTIYSKYEVYITPLLKFLLALITLVLINSRLGYMETIDRMTVVLIVALMCSFMPMNFIVLMSAVFVLLHLYTFSMECAAVIGAGFLLLFLLYLRFSPKDTVVVVLLPLCFLLRIPYVIPISMGLVGAPTSAVSVACGVMVYYMIHYVTQNATVIAAMADEETAAKFKFIIDGLMKNREMVVTIAAFAMTVIVVYLLRRLSIDYAWTIAMTAGAVVNIMVLLVGDLIFEINQPLISVILGTVISFLLALVLQFFVFYVDYSRTEKVQFEDDEYYYYVKAVPKVTVAKPDKKVKQISSTRSGTGRSTRPTHHS
ncbi:MAG: hypothetical protein HFI56_12665 [Lachnospiraceae bacterium]|jgi:hypothetical protein|nr:hypothetical protein [Lachnospiraceae bacterium]MCI9397747.1 hypothetical protein [Lachnospiraceae bacterium]